jgi:hypothetical protein
MARDFGPDKTENGGKAKAKAETESTKMIDLKALSKLKSSDVTTFLKKVDKKTWIKIAGGVAGSIVLLVFVIWPAWVTRWEIRSELQETVTQITTTQGLLQKKPALLKDQAVLSAASAGIRSRLYLPGETSLLLGAVSKLAQQSNVAIVSSAPKTFDKPLPSPYDEQYAINLYDFTLEGGYHELADFVSRIENNPKVLRIQTFDLLPQDKEAQKHMAEMTLMAASLKQVQK